MAVVKSVEPDYVRPFYVWHVEIVEYPPYDEDGVPDNDAARTFWNENGGHWWWPKVAMTRCLSERTAWRRARKLERYGAKVRVVRSDPVTYPKVTTEGGES